MSVRTSSAANDQQTFQPTTNKQHTKRATSILQSIGIIEQKLSSFLKETTTMDEHLQQQQQCLDKSSMTAIQDQNVSLPKLIEKSIIIHKDENGFGLRIKGQSPVFIEHVHENGAAWRAGVRALDLINKVNGRPVSHMDHKDVVLAFKSCSRFVALTLISPERPSKQHQRELMDSSSSLLVGCSGWHSRQPSTYSQKVYQFFNRPEMSHAANAAIRRMSTATSYSTISTMTSANTPMMDRTNSCRSTTSVIQQTSGNNNNKHHHQTNNQSSLGTTASSRLSRQGSVEDQDGRYGSDKRFAVCICCRNSLDDQQKALASTCARCQLDHRQANVDSSYSAVAAQAQHMHAGSLRDVRPTSGYDKPTLSVRQLDTPSSASVTMSAANPMGSELNRRTDDHACAVATNKMPQSMSANSLPTVEMTQAANLRLATTNKPSPLGNEKPSQQQQQQHPKHRPPAPPPSSSSASQQPLANKRPTVNKRVEIIREFIDTERTHTERLRCLNELFYRPLKQAGFMSVEQLRMVFSCHKTLYKTHRQIYHILMSANYDAYSEPLIGSALLEIFEGDLKKRLERAACTFCSAQATNIELLNKMTRRDTKAGEFLAQVTSQRMVGRLGVKDLLASCFQRLTKYPLLLENLLKATPLELPDDSEGDEADQVSGSGRRHTTPTSTTTNRRGQQHAQSLKPGQHHRLNRSVSDELEGEDEGDFDDGQVDYGGGGGGGGREGSRLVANNGAGREPGWNCDDDDNDDDGDDEDERIRLARRGAAEEARRNSRRIMAISLAEEREFIERALHQSRQILVRVNDSIKVAIARNRLKEIWKRTDKYPDVPLNSIDITKQQVIHEGLLTLRLSKRSFDVYVLLLNDYIIILTREGQDKYRLKFFTPEGKSAFQSSAAAMAAAAAASSSSSSLGTVGNILGTSSMGGSGSGTGLGVGANNSTATISNLMAPHQTVYSPIFVIDEHLTTRDAATDENGFYLLCKRKDDSRIYEFASRSPAERLKWRDKIQTAIERQMSRNNRRPSCASTLTKSSSEISTNEGMVAKSHRSTESSSIDDKSSMATMNVSESRRSYSTSDTKSQQNDGSTRTKALGDDSRPSTPLSEPTKIVGTISYVIDDGIVMPSKMESSRVFVDQAIQVNILDGSTLRAQIASTQATN